MRRGRAKENGSTGTWLVLGGGLALLGIGVYLVTRSSSSASTSTTTALAPPPGGGVKAPQLGSPTDPNSTAYACNACFKLNAIGHPTEAAYWAQKCTAGGGTIPTSASQMYT